MYRNHLTNRFNPSLLVNSSSSNNPRENTLQNIQKLSDNCSKNAVRSTERILNLFGENQCNNKPTNVSREKEVDNVKENTKEMLIRSLQNSDKINFNVVYGKKSMKKHKTWDDDGLLEVIGKNAILKDMRGNIIGRTTVNPSEVTEGFRLSMGNKEIEIIDKISNTNELETDLKEDSQEPPLKKAKTYSAPLLPVCSSKLGLNLNYEALVMPCLNTSELWLKEEEIQKQQEVSVDACLASVLRDHQRQGVVFLYECIMGMKTPDYYGAILADEMGLGKTLQCITVVWTLLKKGPYGKPVLKRVLITTPSSLCNNWKKEFIRWLGSHRIFPYLVDAKHKPEDFVNQPRCPVMIISYDMFMRCYEEIARVSFDLIICDEGHRLKNSGIKASKLLHNINCKRRILLTGTPIQNDLLEFYSLVDFVNPGILGNSSEYRNNYESPIVASQCPHASDDVSSLGRKRAKELQERTRTFILRRTQETINKYLPCKHELVVFCQLSERQKNLYSYVTDTWFHKSVPHLTVITALKKICNHPDLFTNDKNDLLSDDSSSLKKILKPKYMQNDLNGDYCGKVTIVQTLMRNLKQSNEKLVLISYYTQTLNFLETVCNIEGLKFLRLDGNTVASTRSKVVEQFNSKHDNSKIFLLSAKAGGVGLNLPGASRLVLFDSDWNPASDAQAMARIWRDGQKRDVYIYRLLCTGTIEEKIYQRQISKTGLSETVVNLSSLTSLKLSTSELKDLFTFVTDTNSLTHDIMNCQCSNENDNRDLPKENEKTQKMDKSEREYQFTLKEKSPQQNLTINQLLEWKHYKHPIPFHIMKEFMLTEVSDKITFIFKNATS